MSKAKRKRSKQANYQKQYSELLRNAKMIYQDLQLGLKLGEKTPSIEDILKEAGTKSGLKRPTKKSIQALKKLQTESGVLRQAYWSMSKGPERDKAKELFEKAYDEEKHYKELQRKERKFDKEIKKYEDELKDPALSDKYRKWVQDKIESLKTQKEEQMKAETYRFMIEIRKQVQRAIEPHLNTKYMSDFDHRIADPGLDIINFINEALADNDIDNLKNYEENARDVIEEYGTIEAEDLYNNGYKILDDLRILRLNAQMQEPEKYENDQESYFWGDDFDPDHPILV